MYERVCENERVEGEKGNKSRVRGNVCMKMLMKMVLQMRVKE